jgi:hypothetical protein
VLATAIREPVALSATKAGHALAAPRAGWYTTLRESLAALYTLGQPIA